jgi:hypothetical protein
MAWIPPPFSYPYSHRHQLRAVHLALMTSSEAVLSRGDLGTPRRVLTSSDHSVAGQISGGRRGPYPSSDVLAASDWSCLLQGVRMRSPGLDLFATSAGAMAMRFATARTPATRPPRSRIGTTETGTAPRLSVNARHIA